MALLSMAKYGAMHGVTKQAATKWKQRGWLVFQGDLVDVEASDRNLKQYRAAGIIDRQPTVNHSQPEATSHQVNASPDSVIQKGLAQLPKSELDRLLQAQRVAIAEYEKRQAKFDTDLREGRLLKTDDVVRTNSLRCLGLRNKLLAIPSEHAIRLANCNDPAQTAEILRDAITDALNDFLTEYGITV